MDTGFIFLEELIQNSRIETSFVVLLESEGLIETTIIDGKRYIQESQLNDLERFANLHYDLSINIEGIDVIQNLLSRMKDLEQELQELRRIRHFHQDLWNEIED